MVYSTVSYRANSFSDGTAHLGQFSSNYYFKECVVSILFFSNTGKLNP